MDGVDFVGPKSIENLVIQLLFGTIYQTLSVFH